MPRPRQRPVPVNLVEHSGGNAEAVAGALHSWALLLADHAQRSAAKPGPRSPGKPDE